MNIDSNFSSTCFSVVLVFNKIYFRYNTKFLDAYKYVMYIYVYICSYASNGINKY